MNVWLFIYSTREISFIPYNICPETAIENYKEQIYSETLTEYWFANSNEIIKENKQSNYLWFNYTYY